MSSRLWSIGVAGVALLCAGVGASAGEDQDWPAYLHDSARSGVSSAPIALPLHAAWTFQPRQAPKPAWPAPAKQDIWHEIRELSPVVTYDRAYHAVISGNRLVFASSANDKVYCLDASTGEILWTFFAEGPIRLAPTVAGESLYFGSDDGWVYCLAAGTGELRWKHRPPVEDRRLPGNGRVISSVPARTGVIVENDIAYCFSGLFPELAVYRSALHAGTGAPLWEEKTAEVSPQGYLLASPQRLFVPTGRTNPAVFERDSAKFLGQLPGGGGTYAVLVDDALASGPSRRSGNELQLSDPSTSEGIATCDGVRMVVSGPIAYIQSKTDLAALDRPKYLALGRERNTLLAQRKEADNALKDAKNKRDAEEVKRREAELQSWDDAIAAKDAEMRACYLWRQPNDLLDTLILAGDTLFTGGDGQIAGFAQTGGAPRWKAEVPGRVYGLSAANGRLYASIDTGAILCFSSSAGDARVIAEGIETGAPYPEDAFSARYAEAAEAILGQSGVTKGYCLVLGAGEGRLAYELAQRSELQIVGIESDGGKVAAGRAALDRAGLYGIRIALHHLTGEKLPYTTYMADLIVSEEALTSGALSVPAAEVYRLLRPYGGVACIGGPGPEAAPSADALRQWLNAGAAEEGNLIETGGRWAMMRRGSVPGAGEWTQLYANSSHTASSSEQLEGPLEIQWFGEPGPRDIIDRHHRPMSPLFKDGRLFVPADNLVVAVNPYNGTPLWQLPVPDSRRVGALKNSGHILLTEDLLYIAREGECWGVEPASGAHTLTFSVPKADERAHDWGYIDCSGDQLVGTAQQPGASFNILALDTVNTLEGDYRPVMISQYLFCLHRHSGEKQWIYRKGAIMNNAIAVDSGRIFFVESRNEESMNDDDGRISIKNFCKSDTYLVALNLKNGKKLWDRPVTLPFHHIMYLNGAEGMLVLSGSYNQEGKVFYGLFGFDMKHGREQWNVPFRAFDNRCEGFADQGGSHGEQWQHPVIINGTVYARPLAFDLKTGEKRDYLARRGGHGCGGLTGSAHYLYGRGSNPKMYPLATDTTDGIALTQVSRPGCWLNIIPAGGLIMIPESSSGCTCAYPLQTSLALIPQAVL